MVCTGQWRMTIGYLLILTHNLENRHELQSAELKYELAKGSIKYQSG